MRTRPVVVAVALVGVLAAGCAETVDGTGTTAGGPSVGASRSGDFPSQSGSVPSGPVSSGGLPSAGVPSASLPSLPTPSASVPVPSTSGGSTTSDYTCPIVTISTASYSFTCIAPGLTPRTGGTVWPVSESKPVDSSGWVMETGGGHWGPANGMSLKSIANSVRGKMLHEKSYGPDPKMTTGLDIDITIDGHKGHVVQTTFTLDLAFAKKRGTTVRQEKLWIVAFEVGTNDVSLWYTSLPDLVKQYWPKVPSSARTIKVI